LSEQDPSGGGELCAEPSCQRVRKIEASARNRARADKDQESASVG
jgi:hypothetical protein